jgi:hypothetical protein
MSRLVLAAAVLALTFPVGPRADEEAGFGALRGLKGSWSGMAHQAGDAHKLATRATFRVISAASAVMLTTDPGTPHEMVTLFHRDDGVLMATHYCAAQNQPRFKAQPSEDAKKLVFEFVDGTNLGAHPGRMQRLVISLPDRDHQVQEWTYREGEQETTMVFELKRKK